MPFLKSRFAWLWSLVLLACAPCAHAQWAVVDVGAITQLIQQVATMQEQLSTARDQLSQARDQFSYDVSVYLEAGPSPSTEASTIVDVSGDEPRIVRLGALAYPRLREVVPELADPRAAAPEATA